MWNTVNAYFMFRLAGESSKTYIFYDVLITIDLFSKLNCKLFVFQTNIYLCTNIYTTVLCKHTASNICKYCSYIRSTRWLLVLNPDLTHKRSQLYYCFMNLSKKRTQKRTGNFISFNARRYGKMEVISKTCTWSKNSKQTFKVLVVCS